MKITMLATSRSGKTCYMLGLYYVMSAMGKHGFNLFAEDEDQGLDMMESFRAIRDNRKQPALTQRGDFAIYPFRLTYGQKTISRFEWVDYRGDDLDKASDKNSPQRTLLKHHLMGSECAYLGISGELLADPQLTDEDVADMAGVAAMGKLLTEVRDARCIKDSFPIVLLVTKYDQCEHIEKKDIVERLKRLFNSFFLKGWHIMICPVAMGKELGKDMQGGMIKPRFVHWPLAFAVHRWMYEEYMHARKQSTEYSDTVEYQKAAGWWRRFLDGIDKETIRTIRSGAPSSLRAGTRDRETSRFTCCRNSNCRDLPRWKKS